MFARLVGLLIVLGAAGLFVFAFKTIVLPWMAELGVSRKKTFVARVGELVPDVEVVELSGEPLLMVDGPVPELVVTGSAPRLRVEALTGVGPDEVPMVRLVGSVEMSVMWPRTFVVPARKARPLPGLTVVHSGDPRFDQAFTAQTADPVRVAVAVGSVGFREAVEASRFPFVFRFEGDRLLVRFEGPVEDAAVFVAETVMLLPQVAAAASAALRS